MPSGVSLTSSIVSILRRPRRLSLKLPSCLASAIMMVLQSPTHRDCSVTVLAFCVYLVHLDERGNSLGGQLEDLREELGGPRGGLEVRGFHVVVAEDRRRVGVEDDGCVEG